MAVRFCLAVLCTLGATAGAQAQVELYTAPGEAPGQGLSRLAWAADVDGDGVDDFVSLHPDDDASGTNAGAIVLRSGVDGSILRRVEGSLAGDRFGTSAASVGDTNDDGWPDLAVGAPGAPGQGLPGYVAILSGADGSELLRIVGEQVDGRFGHAVAGLGDVDADGRGDVLIGAPGEHVARGAAYMASGADGKLLASATGDDEGDQLGISVGGSAPDVVQQDVDPVPIIGAASQNATAGYVQLRSRSDFTLVRTHRGDADGDRLGFVVSPAGDLDGDGTNDYAAAADPRTVSGQPLAPGYVRAWSGADGSLLLSFDGTETGAGYGATLAALGDVDHDGFDDLAIGAPDANTNGAGSGQLTIRSGATGALVHELVGELGAATGFGSGLVCLGDLDGDALPDFVTSEARADAAGPDSGRLLAISLTPWDDLGNGVSGQAGVPVLGAQGSMAPGTDITLKLSNAPALAPVALYIGYALAYDGTTGTFTPTPDIIEVNLVTDASGSLTHGFTWPDEAIPGFTAYFQYRISDGTAVGGEARSNTIEGQTSGH